MAPKSVQEARAWWTEKQKDDDLLETICAHVTNGGSLISLAETWGIPWTWITKWLREDKKREESWGIAMAASNDWFIQRITDELKRLGTYDIRDLLYPDGRPRPVDEWPKDVAAAVAGIEVQETHVQRKGDDIDTETDVSTVIKKIKLESKKGSLELLGKKIGMFPKDRLEVSGRITLEDLVAASQAQEDK